MKIGIDARFYNESGVGRYLRNLIKHLSVLDKKNEYFIFLLPKDLNQFKEGKNFQKVEADFAWYGFAEQFKLPNLLKKYKLDLVHFPHFNVPIFYTGKFIVTIHDLIHQHFSMKRSTTHGPLVAKLKTLGYKKVFQHAIKKSLKIFTPSNFVKQQLIEGAVDSGKIIVTPEAVDDKLVTAVETLTQDKSSKVLNKFGVKSPYIFYVGNAHPHKNIEGLIKAFLTLKENYKNLSLVLSGYDHYFWQRLKKENQFPDIFYTGYVDDEELVALYKNAFCFVMPSFEEGFGIPLLEAMACLCPIVSSNAGSLPEVGGDAALYFDPHDTNDMVNKISQILGDVRLRKTLIEKGKKRYRLFSWKKLAKQTLEVYLKISV